MPVGAAHLGDPAPWLSNLSRPLHWIGRHSYEIYPFHIAVLGLLPEPEITQ